MAPAIEFDDVSKKFRRGESHDSLRDLIPAIARGLFRRRPADSLDKEEFWALRNVSFNVERGEALGIVGPNGAGKSTTLKLLTRILKPTTGRCAVRGRVGALIEVAAGFHPDLTGRENVFLQGAIMGMKRAEIASRFDEIIDFAGVGAFVDTPTKRYSSGMNARLGFSIAAHLRPDVLIIDEVLSVGDMAFQQRCFDRMLDFKQRGIAIVLVSHNLQAVATLCENAIFLANSVKAAGPTAEVLDTYVRTTQKLEAPTGGRIVEITSAEFIAGGMPVGAYQEVDSGSRLDLRVSVTSLEPIDDATFGFLVYRSSDQLLVYNGHIQSRELGAPDRFMGDFVLDLTFRAHLVRGHYYITLHVLHNPTQDYLVPRRQVATFSVHENRSRAGVADVDLKASMRALADPIESCDDRNATQPV